ncbi:MAG TPA: acetylglutamate kinase [Balneolaceae bacterium]|nr:acetylglutamate kinase [Balneolaceae bacterium]
METTIELPITYDISLAKKLEGHLVLIKYGGNAMVDDEVKRGVIADIVSLKKLGAVPVIVHGGGRVIKKILDDVGLKSEFVDGHRKTDAEAMRYVEMALTGSVNSDLVKLINATEFKAVGLSGKDGGMVVAQKRKHQITVDGETREVDLGYVGDVKSVNTDLIHTLIDANYIPVISPVSMGTDLENYNINADMFAGHLAGALNVNHYLALTDVDGLLKNIDDPSSLVRELDLEKAESEIGNLIEGGMIPKVESCVLALKEGVEAAHIINGTASHSILKELLTKERAGTLITH